jgi:hypothetical protein
MRTLHAESNAGDGTRTDPDAEDVITEPERGAWNYRSFVAKGIQALLTRPAVIAADHLTGSTYFEERRQAFLDDLAAVTIPADAVERLEQAEQQLRGNGYVWPGPRPSRRDPGPRVS